MDLDNREIQQLQDYFRRKFGNISLTLKKRKQGDSAEVLLGGEFIGTIYKDVDEGETSYTFTMSILDIDLEDAP